MNAKHSAILLTGLLFLMIGIAWANGSATHAPSCPPLDDSVLQDMLQPTAWARADWNAKTSRWDIDCKQIDAIANIPHPAYNATANAAVPARGGSRGNGNYVNTNPYKAPPDTNTYISNKPFNANMPANIVKAPRSVKREPNTRRPGN